MTITGTNFLAGALIMFGSASATTVTVNSATQIQAVTPANAAGPADVMVEDPGNVTAKVSGGFTYNSSPSGPPTITSVSPTSGPPETQVTVTGTNFNSATTAAFGSTNAGSTIFVSTTQLLATVPSVSTGTYNVTVTDPNPASATLNRAFTVTTPPPAQSLLSGCTVSSLNVPSCATPSGWTFVLADGFDSGVLGNPGIFEYVYGSPGITTTKPHTGSHSIQGLIQNGNSEAGLGIFAATGTSNHIYISFWRYFDPNACGNQEIYFAAVETTATQFYDIMDTQGEPGSCTSSMESVMLGDGYPFTDFSAPTPTAGGGGGSYSGTWNLPLGVWEQVEFEFKGSTCTGSTSNMDGFYRLYINGKLNVQHMNANLNGCKANYSSAGMAVFAGQVFTICNASESNCNTWPPGKGAYNVYVDDVILLKQ